MKVERSLCDGSYSQQCQSVVGFELLFHEIGYVTYLLNLGGGTTPLRYRGNINNINTVDLHTIMILHITNRPANLINSTNYMTL